MTDRSALINAAKSALGLKTDVDLAKQLGVGRAFLCMVKKGDKNLPDEMRKKLEFLCAWHKDEVDQLLGGADGDDQPLPAVPDVVGQVQHESGVLPDQVSDPDSEEPAGDEVRVGKEGAGEGSGQPIDHDGQSGDGAHEETPAKRPRLKRGTRAAIVLREGGVYYPDGDSDHTHRRITGIVRQEGKKTAIVYSYGGDHLGICNRDTFVRWMDPTRASGKEIVNG